MDNFPVFHLPHVDHVFSSDGTKYLKVNYQKKYKKVKVKVIGWIFYFLKKNGARKTIEGDEQEQL